LHPIANEIVVALSSILYPDESNEFITV
jgi:hypothetical protein